MSNNIIIKNTRSLRENGIISSDNEALLEDVARKFSVSITPLVSGLIKESDGQELYRQYVPAAEELEVSEEEMSDPIGDSVHTPVKGITHRYPDRVLLKPIHTCAVYCRFCFRREKVSRSVEALSTNELNLALDYIENDSNIWEVILSGGDPLVLSPQKLSVILTRLQNIPHVQVIRIHTRVPLVAPGKLTRALLESLDIEKALFVVLHCNSHLELVDEVKAGVKKLNKLGIPLLSQSVLLKGVNDSAEQLEKLFRSLAAIRVKPYYLHHGDLAQGTAHFRTSIEDGQHLMTALRGNVSGICQPNYVIDIPGGYGKVPIGPVYISKAEDEYQIKDWNGKRHLYKEILIE